MTLLADGLRLDPGAIGKGVALDAAARVLKEGGVSWALLDFGRQIMAVGDGPDGCGFRVDMGPDDKPKSALYIRDESVATTSNSERGLVVDGRLLGHVLDPRTGKPAILSRHAVVVAPTAAQADAFSTALFVLGADKGLTIAADAGLAGRIWPAGSEPPQSTAGFGRFLARACPAGSQASETRMPASMRMQ